MNGGFGFQKIFTTFSGLKLNLDPGFNQAGFVCFTDFSSSSNSSSSGGEPATGSGSGSAAGQKNVVDTGRTTGSSGCSSAPTTIDEGPYCFGDTPTVISGGGTTSGCFCDTKVDITGMEQFPCQADAFFKGVDNTWNETGTIVSDIWDGGVTVVNDIDDGINNVWNGAVTGITNIIDSWGCLIDDPCPIDCGSDCVIDDPCPIDCGSDCIIDDPCPIDCGSDCVIDDPCPIDCGSDCWIDCHSDCGVDW